MALSLSLPAPALANVKKTDVIAGQTLEQRGWSTSQAPDIDAQYAICVDQDGNVLYERSADTAGQIASMTKIMTAITAMDYDPSLKTQVTVTSEAAKIGESSAGLAQGDTMNLKTALKAMMIASGNDAAQSIATAIGKAMLDSENGDSSNDDACVQRFVQAMNDKAGELGLKNTVFTNPHGLDYGDYKGDLHSTARDVATEVAYAMKNDTFRSIVKSTSADLTVTRNNTKTPITLTSTDTLLSTYKGTNGVKTGYTKKAGACYAGSNKRNGTEYYVVVMKSSDEAQRFTDAETIWDWVYRNKKDYQLINCNDKVSAEINGNVADYPLVGEAALQDWTDRTVKATVADPKQTASVYTWNGNVSQEVSWDDLSGDVTAGQKVGTLTFKQHDNTVATVDLIAAEDVSAPDPFTSIGTFFQRLTANFTGAKTVADSALYNQTPYLVDKTDQTAAASDAAGDSTASTTDTDANESGSTADEASGSASNAA